MKYIQLKWLLDVNVTPKVKKLLEKFGGDAVNLIELGLRRLRNGQVLEKAIEMHRIVFSYDQDFKFVLVENHPGAVVISIHPNTDENVIPILKEWLPNIKINDVSKYITIVEKENIIRKEIILE